MSSRLCCRVRSLLKCRNALAVIYARSLASSMPAVQASTVPLHEKVLAAIRTHSQNPGRIALISGDSDEKHLTFKALLYQIEATASYLSQNGFGKGDVACFVMSNSTAFVVSHLGVLKSGGVVTCATSSCTQATLEHQIQDSKAKLVFTEENILPKVMLAVQQCPNVKEIVCARNSTSDDPLPDSVVDFRKLSTGPVNEVPTEIGSNELAVLPYSDVSDGSPMGLMLTHQNVSSAADIFQMYMERISRRVLTYCDYSQENLLLCSSFASVYGLLCLEIALIMGFTSVILKRFEPQMFYNSVHSYRPRILIAEPAQVVSILKQPASEDFKLSSMEYVLCGGPPIGTRVRKQFLDRFTSVKYMTNGAGLLEGAPAAMIPNHGGRENYGSVGSAISTGEIKVTCPTTGKQMKADEKGELCVRGPTVTQGYVNEGSGGVVVDEDGWYHTGQVGHIDKHGNVFIHGGQSDLIEVHGKQVASAEIEDLLLAHPSISDAAVVGVTDEEKSRTAKAFVVHCDSTLSTEDVQRFVEAQTDEIRLNGGVEFVASIPRAADGHVLRHRLVEFSASEETAEAATA